MRSAAEKALKRLVLSQFRGSQPRISNIRPIKGCDFAIQGRVTGFRANEQFFKFARVLKIQYTQANVVTTFNGTLSPDTEIIFQMHVAIIDTGAK